MNSVQHFEIPADDMDRAGRFYSNVFGWATNQFQEDTILVSTTESNEQGMPESPGAINGDISKRGDEFQHPLIVITVDSIEEHFDKIKSNGGNILSDKIEVADMGYCAYISDCEGNTVGIWEAK